MQSCGKEFKTFKINLFSVFFLRHQILLIEANPVTSLDLLQKMVYTFILQVFTPCG